MPNDNKQSPYYLNTLITPIILSATFIIVPILTAQTNVSGPISSNTTWTLSGSPYIVIGNVLVNNGVTLTIGPGVAVKFNSGKSLQVDGTLIARGKSNNQITFTSNQSSTPGDWGYIMFSDKSTDATYDGSGNYSGGSILEYCVVEYAGGTSVDNNGALRMENAHPFINYCTIRNNSTSGIYAWNLSGTFKITNSTIINNTSSSSSGGGISVAGGAVTIFDNKISNNTASSNSDGGSGGGISITGGTATISNNTISNNTALGGLYYYYGGSDGGGGIYISNNATASILNNEISNNTASLGGGGIYIYSAKATISKNLIGQNTAVAHGSGDSGGGIGVHSGSVTISINTIINNTVSGDGGGICIYSSTAIISQNYICSNKTSSGGYSYYGGGGIGIHSSTATISDNIISNNMALFTRYDNTPQSGGGISVYYGTATISNNSVIRNIARNAAGVSYYNNSDMDKNFNYNTITENQANDPDLTYTVYVSSHSPFNYNNIFRNTVTYELWNDNDQGSANLNAKNNWWGTDVESEIGPKIFDWFDDPSKGLVDYSPFLTSPDTTAPISPPVNIKKYSAESGIQLSWVANPESDLAGYKIHYGSPTGYSFANVIDVSNVTSYILSGVSIVETISVTAYDIHTDGVNDQVEGHESWFSEAIEIPPDISVSPTALNFGNVTVSEDSVLNVSVSNQGSADLVVSATDIVGTNADQFSFVSGQGSFTIPADGGAHSIAIKFSPTSVGLKSATLRITSNDPDESMIEVTLTGDGISEPVPDIAVSPSSKNYGDVQVGSSVSETFVVMNEGMANLNVSSVSLMGTNSGEFSIVSGGGSFTVAPGATHDVVISFKPTTEGVKSATLLLVSDDLDENPLDVALTGKGVPEPVPDIAVSPRSKDYGNVEVGSNVSETFVVTNDGTANLDVSSVSLVGINPGEFSIISGGGSFTVAPGASYDVVVSFHPTTEGIKSATLRFASNDLDENPLEVLLSGKGVLPNLPDIAVSPTALNFGNLVISEDSVLSVSVSSQGSANLIVSATEIVGTYAGQFSFVSGQGSFTIPAGGSAHSIAIRFSPTSQGSKAATLQITSNDPDENPLEIPLSGTGVIPDIFIDFIALDFGDVFVSDESSLTVTVINQGTADLNVSATQIVSVDADQFFFVSGQGSFTIPVGGSDHVIKIKFSPTSSGSKFATLQITSNDPDDNPLDIQLSGLGVIDNTPAYFDITTMSFSPTLNNNCTFKIYIIDYETVIQSTKLFIREGGKKTFDELLLTKNFDDTWSVTIPGNRITERGLEYYIEAAHGGTTTTYPEDLASGPEIVMVNVPLLTFSLATLENAYQMISIPVNADNKKISNIVGDDLGGYDKTQYRIFDWDQSKEKYIELNALSTELPPGKALWLITKEPRNLDIDNSKSVSTRENYPIQLKQGWNMIGVPFAFPVAWSEVNTSNIQGGTLYFYNGIGWTVASKMEPFKGYAVKAVRDATLYIPPHEASTVSKLQAPCSLAETEWQIQIKAQRGNYEDQFNFAGVRSIAKHKWDMLDSAEPPPIGEFVSIYFDHSDWNNDAGCYACDFRETSTEGYIFDFTTESNLPGYTRLTFVPQNLPGNFDWVIVSPQTEIKYAKGEIYTLLSKQNYRLLVGTVSFLNDALSRFKDLPTHFELSQNFPNPFNPVTTIRYGIPKAKNVTLKVYNLLGEEIVTLVNDELKAAGYHVATWDGRDREGCPVASGIYLYQLRAGNFSIIKRMVMVK